MDYMSAGGAVMWIILGLSVIAVTFIIERLIFFAGASADPASLEREFARAVESGDAGGANPVLSGHSSLHRLFKAALDNRARDGERMRVILDGCVRHELYRWEKNLAFLEITAKVSPLLGLLGTVLGMVEMFRTLNMGGSVNAEAVTGGIWKALFTTVAGLMVAIPIIIAHGVLAGRITREEETLRKGADFIMARHTGKG
ncbi:MAG: MotA/TolQ/ExbB proton channel family protein [Synergistaceae bacterium]|jgi:biopolymer transport protein ExbB|nr:MotA/TolQ/ExbB proton channel family protein [Synergistaceae bacterium]